MDQICAGLRVKDGASLYYRNAVRLARIAIGTFIATAALAVSWQAHALPSYTRQTGQPCTSCHLNFPELTPFGRAFKLGGYTLSSGEQSFPPLSAVFQTGFTHTEGAQPGGAAPHFGPNDNFSLEFASIYYAGKIVDNIGAFAQFTYDGIGRNFTLDHTDIRYANTASIRNNDIAFGITANDAPSVEDIYNTTNAFSFPFASPGLAPMPAATTLIDSLAFHVGGIGAYAMVNNTFYGAVTLYQTFAHDFQRAVGVSTSGEPEIDSVAPYWRLAAQREWDQHAFEVGTFGMFANVFPSRLHGAGTDQLTDVGIDAQYQFLGDPHSTSFQVSWTHEDQNLHASQALGLAANSSNRLDFVKLKASYLYENTYGATVSYFTTTGTPDVGLFAPAPITGSNNGSPASDGWIFELDWLPFIQNPIPAAPWAQAKFGLQYITYSKFNGGTQDYDGFGRNASQNNTVFVFAWVAF